MSEKDIKIETELTDLDSLNLINKFWELDENLNFVYKNSDLAGEFNITSSKVSAFCLNHSIVKVYRGVCQKCEEEIYTIANNKKELRSILNSFTNKCYEQLICFKCRDKELNKQQERQKHFSEGADNAFQNRKYEKMQKAFNEKKWEELNVDELDILKHVVISEEKWEVYNRIFPDGNPHGDNAILIWRILNKLDNMDLIWLKRKHGTTRIEEIITLSKLKNHLFDDLSEESIYKQKTLERIFAFVMEKNLSRMNYRHPDYSGVFSLNRDVVLKKGCRYRYGGWINDDGSLYIKITPYEQPFSDTRPVTENEQNFDNDDQSDSLNGGNDDFDEEAPF